MSDLKRLRESWARASEEIASALRGEKYVLAEPIKGAALAQFIKEHRPK